MRADPLIDERQLDGPHLVQQAGRGRALGRVGDDIVGHLLARRVDRSVGEHGKSVAQHIGRLSFDALVDDATFVEPRRVGGLVGQRDRLARKFVVDVDIISIRIKAETRAVEDRTGLIVGRGLGLHGRIVRARDIQDGQRRREKALRVLAIDRNLRRDRIIDRRERQILLIIVTEHLCISRRLIVEGVHLPLEIDMLEAGRDRKAGNRAQFEFNEFLAVITLRVLIELHILRSWSSGIWVLYRLLGIIEIAGQ